jgi:hypothetical protein
LEIRWDDLLADRDADGWTDALELRLHTRADSADTDGDTIADPLDSAPLGKGPSPTAGCSRPAALVAAFFGYRGFADRASPVFVQGSAAANLQYEGISSPVIYLSRDDADSLGLGTVVFEFAKVLVCEPGPQGPCSERADPLAAIELSASGDEAEVEMWWTETWLSACGSYVTVRCARGRWYPVSIRSGGCA